MKVVIKTTSIVDRAPHKGVERAACGPRDQTWPITMNAMNCQYVTSVLYTDSSLQNTITYKLGEKTNPILEKIAPALKHFFA